MNSSHLSAGSPPCIFKVMDQGGPTDLLRLILEHDKRFAKVQEQYQEQYSRLCQAVKKSQRYPVCVTDEIILKYPNWPDP